MSLCESIGKLSALSRFVSSALHETLGYDLELFLGNMVVEMCQIMINSRSYSYVAHLRAVSDRLDCHVWEFMAAYLHFSDSVAEIEASTPQQIQKSYWRKE